MKKLLIVGTGRMGQIRMQAARSIPNLQLFGIVDEITENASKFGHQYQVRHASDIPSFIAENGLPDGIWISAPTPAHEPLIEYAASQCIPVAVEKPVTSDPERTERCYKLCEAAGVELFCAFNRRVDPHFQGAAQHIRNGQIGNVQSMHSISRDHPIPPIEFLLKGGDLFHDCGVHDIDFARSVMKEYGAEINRVYSTGYAFHDTLRKHNVMDLANSLLTFDNHTMFALELSRTAVYGYDQRFEAFGDSGCVKVNNMNEHLCNLETVQGVNQSNYVYSFPQRYEAAWKIEMERFRNVLNKEDIPEVTCVDACRATQIAEACRLSMVHKVPVDIEYDMDKPSRCQYKFNESGIHK